MPTYYPWTTAKKQKLKDYEYPCLEVSTHPLKMDIVKTMPSSKKSFIESLQKWSSPFEELDPLKRFERMNNEEESLPVELNIDTSTNYSKAWSMKRTFILNKYTTGEKLTIVSSFLPGGEKISTFSALIRQVSNLNEKVKHRLEQLDDFDEGSVRKTMGLSQQEFITKVHMLDDEIKKAWDSEQRVKAFKIAIQCSKLLSDVTVMQFYPSKFVLISDVLDNFGSLVYDRLKKKSFGNLDVKFMDIDSNSVPEIAKETCQNWLFKMASIRELLPRLYMEMALLQCYVFISKDEIKATIIRLTKMIRGMGNPLVAIYIRVYLCNIASKLLGKDSEQYFYENLKEFIDEYQQIFHSSMLKKYGTQLLTADQYLNLYVPAVDWLLLGSLNQTTNKQALLDDLLQKCDQIENSELLLCCITSAFDSTSIINKSTTILDLIRKNVDGMVMSHQILASLGEHLCHAESYRQLSSEVLSQNWWKLASSMKGTANFLQVLEPWIQFACLQLSTQHINIILRGTIRYMIKCGQPADDYSVQIQAVVKRMLRHIPDVEELFLMDAFMPLVELVQTSSARTMMAKTVLSIFFDRYKSVQIDDPIVISSLMRLSRILHDSINAVSVEDESKACAELINKFIQASHHDDLEQQLNFYVECRAAFIKLDTVLVALVHAVNTLSTLAHEWRGRWLQRACAAYCFITVPSLHCALSKATLYLLSGQVALLNNCIGQAEANLKALVGLIPDIPQYIQEDGQKKPTHDRVLGLISNFLSTLLVLPDNVDSNSKAYILSGFIKTMEKIQWRKTDALYYTTLLRVLDLLSEMTQEQYAYHIDSVISNDELYGSDEEFIKYLDNHATNICQELLVVLKALADAKETKKQYNLALELFWRIVRRADLTQPAMSGLASNLWMLSQKLQDSNTKYSKTILSVLKNDPAGQRLLEKLKV
ncbi:VPS35 endosomal protein-sorting factor-like isoform X1 [Colias croceus]|uniref:VPS35 endosomal protein-sorting factor-like isoform X1 n=1 Tax=Colias crocea TaxID=72248 RepID=UPI001E27CD58|nr:VPS35 endosomal protein-sorting factor-like isoform X1 [Colias croceus]